MNITEINSYTGLIEQRLAGAEKYNEVDKLIYAAIAKLNNPEQFYRFKEELSRRLENYSPLHYNSTQWSCFRYTLVLLRQIDFEKRTDYLALSC